MMQPEENRSQAFQTRSSQIKSRNGSGLLDQLLVDDDHDLTYYYHASVCVQLMPNLSILRVRR